MFRVFTSLSELSPDAAPCALTIGNFDGVHEGHRRILQRVVELSAELRLTPSVLTFDPHPTKVVAPARAPRLLSTPQQRLHLLQKEGIEQVFVLAFDLAFSQLNAHDFVKQILVDKLHAKAVMVGDNFRFGNRASGDTHLLHRLGIEYGFTTEMIGGVEMRGRMVSSSEVRSLVDKGAVSMACRLLGRPYAVEGDVVHGHGIGSKQTVPTLNLDTRSEILPAVGVYITRTTDLDAARKWPSITNVGYRPTFDGDRLTIETFLLAPLDGATPRRIQVEFLRRVREEKKFDSPEALKTQIFKDVGRAKTYFRRTETILSRNTTPKE
ncbi:MAG: bifunctional riboflavin kinase/FAD synthetase [Bryobacteraceae bacterium]